RQHGNRLVKNADSARVVHGMNTAVSTCETQAEGESVMGRTLAEKIWDAHVVRSAAGEPDLLYIDLHLLHEVTSPQAFDGLRAADRKVRRPDPTTGITRPGVPPTSPVPLYGPDSPFTDPVSRTQVETLRKNCAEFGVRLYPMGDADQGIVHVIGPQLGLTQPGLTIGYS